MSFTVTSFFRPILTVTLIFLACTAEDEMFTEMRKLFEQRAGSKRDQPPSKQAHKRSDDVDFFQFVAEKGAGKERHSALWRLAQLLQGRERGWEMVVRAAHEGNEEAQHQLAAAYSTGVFRDSLVPMDASRGLLLEHMAALSGHAPAAMGLGYRLLRGIGLAESCERALPFYEYAANYAAEYVEHAGHAPPLDNAHLSEVGDAASPWLKADNAQELADYYSTLAMDGDNVAAAMLGNLYSSGSRFIAVNETRAATYLLKAYQLGNQQVSGNLAYLLLKKAVQAKKLGRGRGEVDADFVQGLLRVAMKKGQAAGYVGHAFAHMHGLGCEVNLHIAMEYLQKAMALHPDAGFYLGEMLMRRAERSDVSSAAQAYMASAQLGNVLAMHRLAHLFARGMGVARSCDSAVHYFKQVAERGEWAQELSDAYRLFQLGDHAKALSIFSHFSVMGYEAAQFNAAHILSKVYCPRPLSVQQNYSAVYNASSAAFLPPSAFSTSTEQLEAASRAASNQTGEASLLGPQAKDCELRGLALYALSAAQGNAESFVMLGDYYYYGHAQLLQDKGLAAKYYQQAANLKHTQAIFNLGLMHEAGDGVKQDFHLAKRYYDQAAEVDNKARLPRDIALFMLEGHKTVLQWLSSDSLLLDRNLLLGYLSTAWEQIRAVDAQVQAVLDHWSNMIGQHYRKTFKSYLAPSAASTLREQMGTKKGAQLWMRLKNLVVRVLEQANAQAEELERMVEQSLSPLQELLLLCLMCVLLAVLLLVRYYT